MSSLANNNTTSASFASMYTNQSEICTSEERNYNNSKDKKVDINIRPDESCLKSHDTERKLRKNFFPNILMSILSNSDYSESIRWLHHGKSFVITNQQSLMEEVLPIFFKRSVKVEGFTRKLNRWGFRMVTKGPDCGAYFNSFFSRDHPQLCKKMVCQKNAWNETKTGKGFFSTKSKEICINSKEDSNGTQRSKEIPTLNHCNSYYLRKACQEGLLLNYGNSLCHERPLHFRNNTYPSEVQRISGVDPLQIFDSKQMLLRRNVLTYEQFFRVRQAQNKIQLSILVNEGARDPLVNYRNMLWNKAILALQGIYR